MSLLERECVNSLSIGFIPKNIDMTYAAVFYTTETSNSN
jgi:hypothetical protein